MDEKGKRYAKDEEKAPETVNENYVLEESSADAKDDKDKRRKEKNAKKLEKLLKKNKRKLFRAERENPSEEETLPEESEKYPDHPRRKLPVKRIVAAAIIVVLLFGIVFYAFNSDKLSFHNISNFFRYGVLNRQSEERFPLDIKGVSVSAGNFMRIGQDICYTSDTQTQLLNNYGRSIFSSQHAFITPVLTANNQGALVYNLGGTGYQIITADGETYSGEAQDNILVAAYAKNGVYAIVTQSSGYHSKLYVYDEKHKQIFAYSFADYYVTSVSLNSKGTKAIVAGVSALDGVEISALYVLDFTKDSPLHFLKLENSIIYDVEYLSDRYACAIGNSASYAVNTGNGEIVTNTYDGRNLTAFDINKDTNTYTVSLSGSGDGRNCDIISYTSLGAEDKKFTVEDKIIDVSTYKGRVGLLTGESVMLYSKDGRAISKKKLNSDPHAVVLYTSSDAYVLCTGYIDAFSL